MRFSLYVRRAALGCVGLATVGVCAGFAAEPPAGLGGSGLLSGEVLKQALSGRTLYLSTPIGALPIAYSANGTMFSQSRIHAPFTGSVSDRGVWWVTQSQVCQRWNTWLERVQYCFTFERQGDAIKWERNDGHTGTATLSR